MISPKTHKRKNKHSTRNLKKAVNRGKKRSLPRREQMRSNHERSLSLHKQTIHLPYRNTYLILTRPRTLLRISMQPAPL